MKNYVRFPFLLLASFVLLHSPESQAQGKYYTKKGIISFFSDAPLEKIKAVNRSVTAIIDGKTGAVQITTFMKGFEFEKALMQEHFNENYVESEKYPKADFIGQIKNSNEIMYNTDGEYAASVKGKLRIHGVEREVELNGKIIVRNHTPSIAANVAVLLTDYNIKIPTIVAGKISNSVAVAVNCELESTLK